MWSFKLKLALMFIVATCASGRISAVNVWIDTDPSIGSPVREVDDAYALLFALRSPEIRIVGISTTYGNAPLQRTTQVARDLLALFDNGRNIYPGARFARDPITQTAASIGLSKALREHRQLTYVALGPLTNLAAFLRMHPESSRQIEHVIIVGGQTSKASLTFGFLHIHDANIIKDPDATRTVLASNMSILLAPIETSAHLTLTRGDLRKIGGASSAGDFLYRKSRAWLWFWHDVVRMPGSPVFDALPIVALTRPGLVRIENRFARINQAGELDVTTQHAEGSRRVKFCRSVDAAATDFITQRLSSKN